MLPTGKLDRVKLGELSLALAGSGGLASNEYQSFKIHLAASGPPSSPLGPSRQDRTALRRTAPAAVDRHLTLLRSATTAQGGIFCKIIGDATQVAFVRPPDPVATAFEATATDFSIQGP